MIINLQPLDVSFCGWGGVQIAACPTNSDARIFMAHLETLLCSEQVDTFRGNTARLTFRPLKFDPSLSITDPSAAVSID